MEIEVWKDIPSYEGLYKVSNLGRIYSYPKFWRSGNNALRKHNGKVLIPTKNSAGYVCIWLAKDSQIKIFQVHRLVAIAFLDNPKSFPFVDHIDGDKTNNCAYNLRYCTHRQNLSFDNVKGRCKKVSKYTGVSYDSIRKLFYARIRINGKQKNLGYCNSEFEAHQKYQDALNKIQP